LSFEKRFHCLNCGTRIGAGFTQRQKAAQAPFAEA
jgi:hypothetical protein